jgi:hypothetical protein
MSSVFIGLETMMPITQSRALLNREHCEKLLPHVAERLKGRVDPSRSPGTL